MKIEDTRCCAVKEIANLSDHASPEDAMESFCRNEVDGYNGESTSPSDLQTPSAFYTFTGVIGHRGGRGGGVNPYYQANFTYGPRFADYIRRHKLGAVTSSVARVNRLNHPTHLIRVWMWAPSERNLKRWWSRKRKKEEGV